MNDPAAANLTQVILYGTRLQSQLGEQFMPAFGKAYSDAEIAAIANSLNRIVLSLEGDPMSLDPVILSRSSSPSSSRSTSCCPRSR